MITNSKPKHFLIQEAAKFLGVCPNTLRNFDRKGTLAARRDRNGYRIYTLDELGRFADRELLEEKK